MKGNLSIFMISVSSFFCLFSCLFYWVLYIWRWAAGFLANLAFKKLGNSTRIACVCNDDVPRKIFCGECLVVVSMYLMF